MRPYAVFQETMTYQDLEKRSAAKKNFRGGVLTSNRLIGFAPGWGRIFTARLTMMGLYFR